LSHCCTSRRVAGSIPNIFTDINLPALSSTPVFERNEYQEYFLGIKAAGA
jgi:hypothetical protein